MPEVPDAVLFTKKFPSLCIPTVAALLLSLSAHSFQQKPLLTLPPPPNSHIRTLALSNILLSDVKLNSVQSPGGIR